MLGVFAVCLCARITQILLFQDEAAIIKLESSPAYFPLYSVVLPQDTSASGSPVPSYMQLPSAPNSPPSDTQHLPPLPPLLPPPPFTPTHPVFVHFAGLASSRSEQLRTDAEGELAEIVRKKVEQISQAETELKTQVEMLWRAFRRGVDDARRQTPERSSSGGRRDSNNTLAWTRAADTPTYGTAPVSVRDFTPASAAPKRIPSSSSASRRQSALSASLATSTFHHPAYGATQADSITSPVIQSPSAIESSTKISSSWSGLSRSMPIAKGSAEEGASMVHDSLRRNMDQKLDTATSFKYVTDLEEEMMKKRRADAAQTGERQVSETAEAGPSSIRAENRSVRASTSDAKTGGSARTRSQSRTRASSEEQKPDPKGKRKVTFDVKPDVVTITRQVDAEQKAEEAANVEKNTGGMSVQC
jgi:hypothetical protein